MPRNDAGRAAETDRLLGDSEQGHTPRENRRVRFGGRVSMLPASISAPVRVFVVAGTLLALFVCLLIALWSLPATRRDSPKDDAVCDTPQCVFAAHDILTSLNEAADPCDDFYEFATGGWRQQHPLPHGAGVYGVGELVSEHNDGVIRRILEDTPNGTLDAADRHSIQKLRTFFDGCMDTDAADREGAAPLLSALARLHKRATRRHAKVALTDSIQWLHEHGVDVFFVLGVDGDAVRAPSAATPVIQPGGLGLPDLSYYDEADTFAAYTRAIADAARAAHPAVNETGAFDALAHDVAAFEKELARIQPNQTTELGDPRKTYNPMGLGDLGRVLPALDWERYMRQMNPQVQAHKVIVASVSYLEQLGALIKDTPADTLRAYMYWALIRETGIFLGPRVPLRAPSLHAKNLARGQEPGAEKERATVCTGALNAALGYMAGRFFVADAFSADAKAQVEDILSGIIAAFRARLPQLTWLDKATRSSAHAKAEAIKVRVGYPTNPDSTSSAAIKRWYDDLAITGAYYRDQLAARSFARHQEWSRIGSELNDGALGDLATAEVNAEYSPSQNAIAIPAGIIQRPYFDPSWPQYLQYGALGTVAGHELSHAFDPTGRLYDAQGFLRDWWTPGTAAEFESRQRCIELQYGNYSIPDGRGGALPLNSRFTIGEDVADAGGLAQSYLAWRTLVDHGDYETRRLNKRLPGLLKYSREQLFYIAYGVAWAQNTLPGVAKLRVHTDPHSPPEFRVNGALRNSREFADAFGCRAGDRMYSKPADRCELW